MLRLALFENLRRVAARIAIDRIDEKLANYWAIKCSRLPRTTQKRHCADHRRYGAFQLPMVSAFVSPLAQRLQWKGSEISLALSWLDQHLAEKGSNISLMMLFENQQQAANQVSMSNSINSLRFLAKMDWREFVETMSVVEQTLRGDPHGTYSKMDFYTRDSYRHVVEKSRSNLLFSESQVATIAIDLAKQSALKDPGDLRKSACGLLPPWEKDVLKQKTGDKSIGETANCEEIPAQVQGGFLCCRQLLLTLTLTFLLYAKASNDGLQPWLGAVLLLMLLIASSQFAIAIINWITTILVAPLQLPRMDYSTGIPNDCQTMVVVPAMLVNARQVEQLIDDLEVRYLANSDPRLFALLTDYRDSKTATAPDDEDLVNLALKGIVDLNTKYGRKFNDLFFFSTAQGMEYIKRCVDGMGAQAGKLCRTEQADKKMLNRDFR